MRRNKDLFLSNLSEELCIAGSTIGRTKIYNEGIVNSNLVAPWIRATRHSSEGQFLCNAVLL